MHADTLRVVSDGPGGEVPHAPEKYSWGASCCLQRVKSYIQLLLQRLLPLPLDRRQLSFPVRLILTTLSAVLANVYTR
jgi:hypothetical protein